MALSAAGPLPSAVQACIALGECAISLDSSFELGGIAAFEYQAPHASGYLVRYPVLAPSLARDGSDLVDTNQDPPVVRHVESLTILTGSLWLGVQARYTNSAGDPELQLYMDQVQPAEQRLLPRFLSNDWSPTVLHFTLTRDALQASQAYRRIVLDPLVLVDEGSLHSAEPLVPCAADRCSMAQSLSLVGLVFTTQGEDLVLNFAPQDTRRMLYSEEIGYDHPDNGFHRQRDYFVQPVPLPGAGMLALLSVGLLLPLAQRARPLTEGLTPIDIP